MEKKVLIVENEKMISRFLFLELEHEGYKVRTARNGASALKRIRQETFDAVLADWMLSDMGGLDFCLRVRRESSIPIVILAAKADIFELSRMMTDIVPPVNIWFMKPFGIEKMLDCLDSALIQNEKQPNTILSSGQVTLDIRTHCVTCRGERVELSKKEFALLQLLLQNKNAVLTREDISTQVWGYSYTGNTNVIDVTIKQLRNKLDDAGSGFKNSLIQTVRGIGYMIRETNDENLCYDYDKRIKI